jgi:hypothetical protein|tara:strand:- start:1489 stop:1680 length:192 start_codon:yes stop_codon:yes gene_type:complete
MKGVFEVFRAVASAMIGVGKKKDLVRDFESAEKNGPWSYIFVGLLMTVVFIGVIVTVVKFVLA